MMLVEMDMAEMTVLEAADRVAMGLEETTILEEGEQAGAVTEEIVRTPL
jgi:hypothetical protein